MPQSLLFCKQENCNSLSLTLQLSCPLLNLLQQIMFIFLSLLGARDLDAVLLVWSHESALERQYHLYRLPGYPTFDVAQDMIGFLNCKQILVRHVDLLLIHQHPQVFLSVATFQLIVCPMSVFVLEIASTHVTAPCTWPS